MNLRNRHELQKFKQREQEREAAEREATEKPIRDAIEKLNETQREYFTTLRGAVLTKQLDGIDETALQAVPRLRDGETRTPEAVRDAFTEFKSTESSFKPSQEGFSALTDFMDRNSLDPESPLSWAAAFRILSYVGAMPEPQTESEQQELEPSDASLAPSETEEERRIREYREWSEAPVVYFEGRNYSQRELDSLSSEEFRRVCRIPKFNRYEPQPRH